MTEQIERELTELFSDRAERLDVRPPLPTAQVRRARLQSGLAVAAVIAVLAGGSVVGARLAGQQGGGAATVASSGDAAHDLDQVVQRMLAGRWHLVLHNGAPAGVSTGPDVTIDFDGPAKTAILRSGGQVRMMQVAGRTYELLSSINGLTKFLPPGAKWQELPESMTSSRFGGGPLVNFGGTIATADLAGDRVTRTATGYRLHASDAGQSDVTDIRIGPDGLIASMHVVTSPVRMGGAPTARAVAIVTDATFTRLTAPLSVAVPDPRTVVTRAQWEAAMQQWNGTQPNVPGQQPQTCATASTTDQGGMTTSTVECSAQVRVVGPPPGVGASPTPSPTHS